jgi:hypothetical protein
MTICLYCKTGNIGELKILAKGQISKYLLQQNWIFAIEHIAKNPPLANISKQPKCHNSIISQYPSFTAAYM